MHCNAALDKNQTCSLLNILISCLASNFCFAQLASIRIGNNLIIQPRGNNLIVQIWKFARKLAFRSHKYCCLCQNSCYLYICLTFFSANNWSFNSRMTLSLNSFGPMSSVWLTFTSWWKSKSSKCCSHSLLSMFQTFQVHRLDFHF